MTFGRAAHDRPRHKPHSHGPGSTSQRVPEPTALRAGWVNFRFRRPVYLGGPLEIRTLDSGSNDGIAVQIGTPQTTGAVLGRVGHATTGFATPPEHRVARRQLLLETAPVGVSLRPVPGGADPAHEHHPGHEGALAGRPASEF
jgi:hypothetical protein